MANKKTSEEVDGISLQFNDQIRTARDGNNYAIFGNQFLAEDITLSVLHSMAGDSLLVPNKFYKITDFDSLYFDDDNGVWKNDTVIYVQALNRDTLSSIAYHNNLYTTFILTIEWVWNITNPLNPSSSWPVEIHRVEDDRGNVYLDTVNGNYVTPSPIPIYAQNGKNSRFTNSTFKGQININDGNLNINNSVFIDANIIGADLNISYCNMINGGIESNLSTFHKTDFINFYLYTTYNTSIQYSYIRHGELDAINNANIANLKISMNGGFFLIDGTYNSATNNWRGEVIASDINGYSTVECAVTSSNENVPATYYGNKINIIPDSPVGIYKLQNGNDNFTFTNIIGNHSDSIPVKFINDSTDGSKFYFSMQTTAATINGMGDGSERMLKYHGATAKIGDLEANNSYISFRKAYTNAAKTKKCFGLMMDSVHFD